jgi:hypothetical protein
MMKSTGYYYQIETSPVKTATTVMTRYTPDSGSGMQDE